MRPSVSPTDSRSASTATAAWSAWRNAELAHYCRRRFPARVFLPLAAGLCLAGAALGGAAGPAGALAGRFVLVVLLLFAFRLWDDLADVRHDRLAYPERLPGRAPSLAPYWLVLATALLAAGALTAWQTADRLAVFLGLVAGFAAWYGRLRRFCPSAVVAYHVVLIKYPAFAYLAGDAAGANAVTHPAGILAAVYLALCVYEVLHDRRLRTGPARACLAVEAPLLVGCVLHLVLSGVSRWL
jgi:hypothetical protein